MDISNYNIRLFDIKKVIIKNKEKKIRYEKKRKKNKKQEISRAFNINLRFVLLYIKILKSLSKVEELLLKNYNLKLINHF